MNSGLTALTLVGISAYAYKYYIEYFGATETNQDDAEEPILLDNSPYNSWPSLVHAMATIPSTYLTSSSISSIHAPTTFPPVAHPSSSADETDVKSANEDETVAGETNAYSENMGDTLRPLETFIPVHRKLSIPSSAFDSNLEEVAEMIEVA